MSALANIVFVLVLIAMFAIWIYGAVSYTRGLQAMRAIDEQAGMTWHALLNWMFAARRLKGEAAVHAVNVNKAVYGFMISVAVAAAAAIFTAFPSEPVR